MTMSTDEMVDRIMRRLKSEPVGEPQVAAVLRALVDGKLIRELLSPEATERGRAGGAETWETAQVWGAGDVLFDLIENLKERAAQKPPREELTADYVDGWNARQVWAEEDSVDWRYAMRGPDKKIYHPAIAADIREGSVIVRHRPKTDWEETPHQDVSVLRLREDPMMGGRYDRDEYTYESWLVGHTWEYRILGTSLLVRECKGEMWAEHQATCGECGWRTFPLQSGAESMMQDAWKHWTKEGHDAVLAGD
jgi:hypothetical protein